MRRERVIIAVRNKKRFGGLLNDYLIITVTDGFVVNTFYQISLMKIILGNF